MRRLLLFVSFALAVPVAGNAAAAQPRLDRSFGVHHGYWVRPAHSASPARMVAMPGGGGAVVDADGTVWRIAAGGRPDTSWGDHGKIAAGRPELVNRDVTPWGDRLVITAVSDDAPYSPSTSSVIDGAALVVDARGRRLRRATDGVERTLPSIGSPGVEAGFFNAFVSMPDGRLWDVAHSDFDIYRFDGSLGRHIVTETVDALNADGTRAAVGVIDPPIGRQLARPNPVPSAGAVIVTSLDAASSRVSLLRITGSGATDPGFARVWLLPNERPVQMLAWQNGAVVLTDAGHVLWIGADGQVLHRRTLPVGSAIALDAAQRLLVVYGHTNRASVTLRRLRAGGASDASFGNVRLRAPGLRVEPVGVLPESGGRIVVLGRTVKEHTDHRFTGTGAIGWGMLTR